MDDREVPKRCGAVVIVLRIRNIKTSSFARLPRALKVNFYRDITILIFFSWRSGLLFLHKTFPNISPYSEGGECSKRVEIYITNSGV